MAWQGRVNSRQRTGRRPGRRPDNSRWLFAGRNVVKLTTLVPPEGFEPSTSRFQSPRRRSRPLSARSALLRPNRPASASARPPLSAPFGRVGARREYIRSTERSARAASTGSRSRPTRRGCPLAMPLPSVRLLSPGSDEGVVVDFSPSSPAPAASAQRIDSACGRVIVAAWQPRLPGPAAPPLLIISERRPV
jgi:hypothetical protein